MIEDFERESLRDSIYIEETAREQDAKFWEWYHKSEGTVIIIKEDGTKEEVEENLKDYKLPF